MLNRVIFVVGLSWVILDPLVFSTDYFYDLSAPPVEEKTRSVMMNDEVEIYTFLFNGIRWLSEEEQALKPRIPLMASPQYSLSDNEEPIGDKAVLDKTGVYHWTFEEDGLLIEAVKRFHPDNIDWYTVSAFVKRKKKSCYARWMTIKPDVAQIQQEPLSYREKQIILAQRKHKKGWSEITAIVNAYRRSQLIATNRTSNHIKNYCNNRALKKKRRQERAAKESRGF